MGDSTKTNRGRRLETAVLASQRTYIRVRKTSAGVKWLPGGRQVLQRGPVDFVGTICGTGGSICFEAKQTDDPIRFAFDLIKRHQITDLVDQGSAGAVAGVLIESTAVRRYFWLPWHQLDAADRQHVRSLQWTDFRLVELGPTDLLIPFYKVAVGGRQVS